MGKTSGTETRRYREFVETTNIKFVVYQKPLNTRVDNEVYFVEGGNVCLEIFVGATRRVAPTEVWLSAGWCIEMHPTIKPDESSSHKPVSNS